MRTMHSLALYLQAVSDVLHLSKLQTAAASFLLAVLWRRRLNAACSDSSTSNFAPHYNILSLIGQICSRYVRSITEANVDLQRSELHEYIQERLSAQFQCHGCKRADNTYTWSTPEAQIPKHMAVLADSA